MSCGQALGAAPAAAAPAPEPVDPVRRYIPPELLAKLERARAGGGLKGERRIVTMLFCDLKGSTAAAEKLDPEDWAEVMNGAFAHLIAPVYRYEGTLARLMGDAILAFFGAPIAHEDDPQRAVLAGLAITRELVPFRERIERELGIELDVRVGINTGLVVVGEVGSDLRLEYTAMGDAVNLAARMEQTAAPGTVRVAEATWREVAPLFDGEDLGAVEVKGKQEPVRAFRVVGPKARPGRLRGLEGIDSPMVGRDRELGILRGHAGALARGSGHVVSIMGEAGLGKSRLVAELRRALESDAAAGLSVHEGRTLSYQSSVPYAPVVDLLRGVLGLGPEGGASPTHDAALGAIGKVTGDELLAQAVSPFIASVLGVPVEGAAAERVRYMEPPARHAAIAGAVAELLAAASARRPLLLVFEDLHWADTSSLQVIERLLPLAASASLLLLLVLRPRPDEPSWRLHEVASREHAHRYTHLPLDPLGAEDSRALVANLLHVEGLSDNVRLAILERAEGNPYFVEEVIRSFIDQGVIVREGDGWRATRDVEGVVIPGSLAAVLGARLDRLDEPTKHVAQIAAVMGRELDHEVLARVLGGSPDQALGELERRGLVRERARLPRRLYWFKHVLVQEAAYQSLLLKTRREVHGQVAAVLAELAPDRAADIARHYLEAKDGARALPHLVAAAERSARAYSTPEALRQYGRAVELLDAGVEADAALATRVFEGRGGALMLSMDVPGAIGNWHAMIAWAAARGDEPMRVSALNKLAMIHGVMMGDVQEGKRLLDESQSRAEQVNCQPGLAEQCMVRCAVHLGRAEFDVAYGYLDRAAEIGRALSAEGPLLFGMTHIGNTLLFMTEFEKAGQQIEATLAKARELGNQKYQAEVKVWAQAVFRLYAGDVAGAIAAAREGVEIAERIGDAFDLSVGLAALGRLALLEGRYEEALAFGERAVAAGKATGMPYLASLTLACFGGSLAEASPRLRERALALHAEAAAVMKMPSGDFFGADCYAELGGVALATGDVPRARQLFEEGLASPNAMSRLGRPRLLSGLAAVELAEGRLDEAQAHVDEARRFAEERKMRPDVAWIRFVEARVAQARGDTARASTLFDEAAQLGAALGFRPLVARARAAAHGSASARALVAEMAAAIHDPDLRAGFEASARAWA
jgi:class 3 adenylate cyclase/tetratricopeptide (TPR) repeat protein